MADLFSRNTVTLGGFLDGYLAGDKTDGVVGWQTARTDSVPYLQQGGLPR